MPESGLPEEDWRALYELRDDLEPEDKQLLRRFIHYVEKLERRARRRRITPSR